MTFLFIINKPFSICYESDSDHPYPMAVTDWSPRQHVSAPDRTRSGADAFSPRSWRESSIRTLV